MKKRAKSLFKIAMSKEAWIASAAIKAALLLSPFVIEYYTRRNIMPPTPPLTPANSFNAKRWQNSWGDSTGGFANYPGYANRRPSSLYSNNQLFGVWNGPH